MNSDKMGSLEEKIMDKHIEIYLGSEYASAYAPYLMGFPTDYSNPDISYHLVSFASLMRVISDLSWRRGSVTETIKTTISHFITDTLNEINPNPPDEMVKEFKDAFGKADHLIAQRNQLMVKIASSLMKYGEDLKTFSVPYERDNKHYRGKLYIDGVDVGLCFAYYAGLMGSVEALELIEKFEGKIRASVSRKFYSPKDELVKNLVNTFFDSLKIYKNMLLRLARKSVHVYPVNELKYMDSDHMSALDNEELEFKDYVINSNFRDMHKELSAVFYCYWENPDSDNYRILRNSVNINVDLLFGHMDTLIFDRNRLLRTLNIESTKTEYVFRIIKQYFNRATKLDFGNDNVRNAIVQFVRGRDFGYVMEEMMEYDVYKKMMKQAAINRNAAAKDKSPNFDVASFLIGLKKGEILAKYSTPYYAGFPTNADYGDTGFRELSKHYTAYASLMRIASILNRKPNLDTVKKIIDESYNEMKEMVLSKCNIIDVTPSVDRTFDAVMFSNSQHFVGERNDFLLRMARNFYNYDGEFAYNMSVQKTADKSGKKEYTLTGKTIGLNLMYFLALCGSRQATADLKAFFNYDVSKLLDMKQPEEMPNIEDNVKAVDRPEDIGMILTAVEIEISIAQYLERLDSLHNSGFHMFKSVQLDSYADPNKYYVLGDEDKNFASAFFDSNIPTFTRVAGTSFLFYLLGRGQAFVFKNPELILVELSEKMRSPSYASAKEFMEVSDDINDSSTNQNYNQLKDRFIDRLKLVVSDEIQDSVEGSLITTNPVFSYKQLENTAEIINKDRPLYNFNYEDFEDRKEMDDISAFLHINGEHSLFENESETDSKFFKESEKRLVERDDKQNTRGEGMTHKRIDEVRENRNLSSKIIGTVTANPSTPDKLTVFIDGKAVSYKENSSSSTKVLNPVLSCSMVKDTDIQSVYHLMNIKFPWFEPVTKHICNSIMTNRKRGVEFIKFDNTIIYGNPGIGKTAYMSELGKVLGIPVSHQSLAGMSDALQINGTNKGFYESVHSLPLSAMLETERGNPIIALDEVEKSGGTRDRHGCVTDALLPLLEKSSSSHYRDVSVNKEIDASRINYIFTANSLEGLKAPFKDRCTIISVDGPKKEHIHRLLVSIRQKDAMERNVDLNSLPSLDENDVKFILSFFKDGYLSIRKIETVYTRLITAKINAIEEEFVKHDDDSLEEYAKYQLGFKRLN